MEILEIVAFWRKYIIGDELWGLIVLAHVLFFFSAVYVRIKCDQPESYWVWDIQTECDSKEQGYGQVI